MSETNNNTLKTSERQITLTNQLGITNYTENHTVYEVDNYTIGVTYNATEMVKNCLYICCDPYDHTRNNRIKKAELTLYQLAVTEAETNCKLGIYAYDSWIYPAPTDESNNLIDYVKIKNANDEEIVAYTFDVTDIFEKMVEEGRTDFHIFVKPINADLADNSYITVYGKNSDYPPKVTVTCESNYGVNTNYRSDSHELGRFGQGSIDLQYGNLMFESEDFAWGGNRMPVTIKHLYNSLLYNQQYNENSSIGLNTANFSAMKLGLGFKLNIMQSMVEVIGENKYIYTGENGEEVHLLKKADNGNIFVSSQEDGELEYNDSTRILDNGDKYLFDENGRLIKITDGDNENNAIEIVYTDNKLTAVKDAVNRVFTLGYDDNGYLTSITAPDGTQITYTYASNLLTAVNYPNGKSAQITYTSKKPTAITLYDNGVAVQKMAYTFNNYSVIKVEEYGYKDGVSQTGITKTYTYSQSAGRTVVHSNENSGNTVYVFNDDGEVTNEYITPQSSTTTPIQDGKGVTVINNLLFGHNFEKYADYWGQESANAGNLSFELVEDEEKAVYGKKYLRITSNNANAVRNGICQTAYVPDNDVTFSAYIRVVSGFTGENDGAYLSIYHSSEPGAQVNSEKLRFTNNEFVRLSVTFEQACESGFSAAIMLDGEGVIEVNAPQFEYNAAANDYNMLTNCGYYMGADWTLNHADFDFEEGFCANGSLKIEGEIEKQKSGGQTVIVKSAKSTRETFKLSGWAKGYALPTHEGEENAPTFRLRAVINYVQEDNTDEQTNETDGADTSTNDTQTDTSGTLEEEKNTETVYADFCPSVSDWQYTEVEFSKQAYRDVENIQVYCDYDYNYGTAYFDDIGLFRTQIETNLSEEDFAVEDDYTDESGTENNDNQNQAEETEEFNAFNELLDAFGNTLTETTFTDGEFGTIYRSFGYDEDGNNLVKETDARGNATEYTVDGETSKNQEVTDRLGNKTAYEYDNSGRTTRVISKNAQNEQLAAVSYTYNTYDDLTEIVRGDGLKYQLKYDAFRNLESIGIDGKTDGDLIKYTYTNGGRISSMTYANGDKMSASYDGQGNMIAERWGDKNNNLTAHYVYGYNAQGEIVRTIDKIANKMYNYTYEDGRLVRATESNITINDFYGLMDSKTVIASVIYHYNGEGTLTEKRITTPEGEQVVTYTTAENDAQLVKTTFGEHNFISVSKNDTFGRKEFDELQLGTGFVSRKFEHLKGSATDEHIENKMLKSVPTTQLVSEITFSNGRTISYEYDAEERITKVIDSIDGTTEYTYDALGQLLTETKNGQAVNTMTYDNYGNIVSKNGKAYVYDQTWKDKLISYNGQAIAYDKQGNPTTYLGNTLSWEKGRQLKSFGSNTYTYNANGIRNSKTVDGIRHDFYLDGGKILKEVWNGNVLETVFDNEESVCGIIYNGTPYYFLKNLQGDIIAITDKSGKDVARYSYDAWGKCTIEYSAKNNDIAFINPFCYRGYYYDSETGLYYLQSRYYDAEVGRFINGDMVEIAVIPVQILQTNLFAYCENEPVISIDASGYWYYSLKDLYNKDVKPYYNKLIKLKKKKTYNKVIYSVIKSIYNFKIEKYNKYKSEYEFNLFWFDDRYANKYIFGQDLYPYNNLKFSGKPVVDVGCGPIAIYNVMKALSKKPYFPDVLNECYLNGLQLLNATWGTNAIKMAKYFDAHNVSYKKTRKFDTWIKNIKEDKLGIMLFWNAWNKDFKLKNVKNGMHFTMVKYKNDKYDVYNAYSNSKDIYTCKNLKELKNYMGGSFSYGYTFSKR